MSYNTALKAAGFTLLDYKRFGDYQGEWVAEVITPDGVHGYIHDWYGSCSVCDAFEADVGWEPWGDDEDEQKEYDAKVEQFGKKYIDTQITKEQVLNSVSSWHKDEVSAWLREKTDA